MPTGTALRDARVQLFAAAERLLLRDGPSGLTSRALTTEADVAKGVLHRHFDDFDDFLAELVRDRIRLIERHTNSLYDAAGTATVVRHLSDSLTMVFQPLTVALVSLIISRDELRGRLRRTTPTGVPLLTEATTLLSSYLAAEQHLGRIVAHADVNALALALIGTGHLLFAGELDSPPEAGTIDEVVAAAIVGADPGGG